MIFGRHMNRYYLRFAPVLLMGLLALVAVDYFQLVIPNLYQMVINGINQGFVEVDGQTLPFDMDFLLDRVCMPMVGVILAIVAGRFFWRLCFMGSAIRLETDLRDRMFDNCKNLSREFYQENKVGNLMSLFTNDLDTVQDCFGWGVLMFFDALFMGGMAIVKMWGMNPLLTVLSMIPMVFLLCCATIIGRKMMRRWEIRQEAFSKLSDFSQESFSGIAVIKAFVKEAKELLAFKELNKENEVANINHTIETRGFYTVGQLVEFIGYFNAVIWPIMAVGELIDMTSRGQASMNRVSELLDAAPTVVDKPGAKPIERVRGGIEFRDLTFRYPVGEYDALENISFKIEPGENVGLVGKTGSGKTTLVNILSALDYPTEGDVFFQGNNITKLSEKERGLLRFL